MNDLKVLNRVMTSLNKISTLYINTPSGRIEEDKWIELVRESIEKNQENKTFSRLKTYCKENCAWLNEEDEIEKYSLELYASRIFENKSWVGFSEFKEQYMEDICQLKLF